MGSLSLQRHWAQEKTFNKSAGILKGVWIRGSQIKRLEVFCREPERGLSASWGERKREMIWFTSWDSLSPPASVCVSPPNPSFLAFCNITQWRGREKASEREGSAWAPLEWGFLPPSWQESPPLKETMPSPCPVWRLLSLKHHLFTASLCLCLPSGLLLIEGIFIPSFSPALSPSSSFSL